MMEMLVVDRIIGNIAVCVRGDEAIDIPLAEIDGEPREGDVLRENGTRYAVDTAATGHRTAAIQERFNRIKNRSKP